TTSTTSTSTTTSTTTTTTTTTDTPCNCSHCGSYNTFSFTTTYPCSPSCTTYSSSTYTGGFGIFNSVVYECTITSFGSTACYYGGFTNYSSFCNLRVCGLTYFYTNYYYCS
ncbi:unnamed protein product, partial [Adineta steineri]